MQLRDLEPWKAALAGAGMLCWYDLVGWRYLGERVRVVAVCDPDGAKAAQRAEEFSIPHIYRNADAMFAAEAIDALDVASPRQTHAGWVEAAAVRGIERLCQKPLTRHWPSRTRSSAVSRASRGSWHTRTGDSGRGIAS
jgi:predicted dehydrogenase